MRKSNRKTSVKPQKKVNGFTAWQVAESIAKCEKLICDLSEIESLKLQSEKSFEIFTLCLIIEQLREKFKKINLRSFDYGETRKAKFTPLEIQIGLMVGLFTEDNIGVKMHSAIVNMLQRIQKKS